MHSRRLALTLLLAAACSRSGMPTEEPSTAPSSEGQSAASAPAQPTSPPAAPPRGDDTERKSKNGRLSAVIGGVPVLVQYGRPAVRGREVFGALIPYGEVWRTGADEATTLTLSKPAQIAGSRVEPGTYALFTIPGEESWTFILNKPPEQWGAYKYDPSKDVLKAEVPVEAHSNTEILTFAAEQDALTLAWAKVLVRIPVEAP